MKKFLLSTLFISTAFSLLGESFQIDFSNSNIVIKHPQEISASVKTGPGVYYNSYYKYSWIMHFNGQSYIDVTFTNNFPEGKTATLDLIHLSSMAGNTNYSPITITLNGNEVVKDYSPASPGYQPDSYEITPFVKTGENKIRISFGCNAVSNYWIQKLEVNFQ